MDQFLLTLFFFARPIMFIDMGLSVGGLNFFELLTIAFSLILALLALWHAMSRNPKPFSFTEWMIVAFTIWCTVTLVLYPENSNFKTYVKFVLPLLTFMILKRIVLDRHQYLELIKWMIIGFTLPVFLSAIWTLMGRGVGQEIYWTGLVRYQGVYADIHNMGHCMGFLIMLCIMYAILHSILRGRKPSNLTYVGLWFIGLVALFCLYKSQTRTVYFGLLIFLILTLYFYNRSRLFIFLGSLGLITILFTPIFATVFYDFVNAAQGKNVEMAGSGRPFIWKHNLAIFESLPLDRQLAGVGIGNTLLGEGEQFTLRKKVSIDSVWNSHNDFLEVLMQTGAIGLLLWLGLTGSMLVTIVKVKGHEKWVFLSFYLAVLLMNCLSNSYISRFGLAQMYFMILSYFEISASKNRIEAPKFTGVRA